MTIPTDSEILSLLDRLDEVIADDLETLWLEFKPWIDPKQNMREASEVAICLANGEGGVLVFGVSDRTKGRSRAIHGAKGYDLDTWRRGIYDSTQPNLSVDISEIHVPEGTRKLLIVRVAKGPNPPYGTAQGIYKRRVGKNCMPMDAHEWARSRYSTGTIDWSGEPAEGLTRDCLDPLEIVRGRRILSKSNPSSELNKLDDEGFLQGLGAIRNGDVTRAGLLLFGKLEVLQRHCPQHGVHYIYLEGETKVVRNDTYQEGLLNIFERIEQTFTGPSNPEQEISIGFPKLRIPAFPIDVVREAVLNAVTHRDYTDPNEVVVRHTKSELIISSPGAFLEDITPDNILWHEAVSRNKTLAEAFQKLGLVERAGVGRRRIFIPMLSYGKRPPLYESTGERVILKIFDGTFDQRMAALVAQWRAEDREIELIDLLLLSYLKDSPFIDSRKASELLQKLPDEARVLLDKLALRKTGILEKRGRTKAATYHLRKEIAKDLIGKAAHVKTRGLNPIRYAEMVKEYLRSHQSISPQECRELLSLGESDSARSEVSRYLRRWSQGPDAFLDHRGEGPTRSYRLKKSEPNID